MTTEPRTLVWIDSERALIVRWDGSATVTQIESEVPSHRRMGGHVSHDANLRTIGSPSPDPHRLEHLRHYLRQVADRLEPSDPIEVIGPGTVHEHLADLLIEEGRHQGRSRVVLATSAARLSEAQLIARLRTAAGDPPRRGRRKAAGSA